MATLTKKQLLDLLLLAVDASGWRALLLNPGHPFGLRLFRNDEKAFDVRVYIWNCTHGGGSARAADEYRVQLTGVVPNINPGETTLLLGWHDGYGVFVAFDINKHVGQSSHSPSIQVKEDTLANAHQHAFSIYKRQNKEIAVAFRRELFVEYTLNSASLHKTGKAQADLSLLNNLETLTDEQIDLVINTKRKTIISQIARKYRAQDFRHRVLGAYQYRCAVCGVQLKLIDAAHIIPVAAPTSTDETTNGIALCILHHTALDRNLISFDENYKIEVSKKEAKRLADANLVGGLREFKRHLTLLR
jgi:putative restriction endonuclease